MDLLFTCFLRLACSFNEPYFPDITQVTDSEDERELEMLMRCLENRIQTRDLLRRDIEDKGAKIYVFFFCNWHLRSLEVDTQNVLQKIISETYWWRSYARMNP